MILHQSTHAEVKWLEKERVVFKKFTGFIYGEELHSAFNSGYEQLKKSKGYKWLSDNRGLPVYKQEDIEWINNDWFPRMQKAGWKYWALIEPETSLGHITMKKFAFYSERGIVVQVFKNIEEGLAWLSTF
ncbi:MAG: hypothetical protein RIT27_282 [Pseudomonadota bacterium]